MIIPWQDIPKETLQNLIEYFILREDTDYGEHEISMKEKVTRIYQQLETQEVVVVYSELHESVDIKHKSTFQ